MPRAIALVTDFGLRDPYAGVLELAIVRIAPEARVVHVTHGIPPQRVDVGSFVLSAVAAQVPDDTVVCAVVDPGVGTARAAIAVRGRFITDARALDLTFVLPDNGLLTEALPRLTDVRVARLAADPEIAPNPSSTFHGRDVFAPAAARLACGAELGTLGPRLDPADATRPRKAGADGGRMDGHRAIRRSVRRPRERHPG